MRSLVPQLLRSAPDTRADAQLVGVGLGYKTKPVFNGIPLKNVNIAVPAKIEKIKNSDLRDLPLNRLRREK
jgi:hypothetical protein